MGGRCIQIHSLPHGPGPLCYNRRCGASEGASHAARPAGPLRVDACRARCPVSGGRASVDEELIVAYLQGTLPAEARAALEDRLADDSDARQVVAALASLSIFSSTLPAGEPVRGGSTTTDDRAASSLPAPAAGELLAEKYRVVGALGHGAMGIVLEVEHVLLRERYALKLLRRATAADPLAVQRLVREARAAMRIDSPHVARVFDLGVLPDGRLFLVMELLSGRDLKSILAERRTLPIETAVAWIAQAARGVGAAHAAAVVHRDLKPANLFVVGEGADATIKVVDFGLSKAPEVHRRASDDAALTTSGSMIGSPMYMAPEQIRDAKTADARGDVWALGVVLYEMLAGKPPFSATTVSGVLASIMVDEVPSLAAHQVPPSLERVILACLEKRQAKRIASAEVLLQRLARWQEEEAPTPET
jgi:serine/threonine protein kinase